LEELNQASGGSEDRAGDQAVPHIAVIDRIYGGIVSYALSTGVVMTDR
jgi:hypothetical protein